MKKILYDAQIFRKQNFGGISRYFTELMIGLKKTGDFKTAPEKFYSSNIYLSQYHLTSFNWLKNKTARDANGRLSKLILKVEDQILHNTLSAGKYDIFHPTYYNPSFLGYLSKKRPFVLTVHDMIHENYYNKTYEYWSGDAKNKAVLIPKADHIIAVSNNTKKDILRHYPQVAEDKITVIYHGSSLHGNLKLDKPAALPERYLLYIGIKKHYKNFFWMAGALKDYLEKNNTILLCAGGFPFDEFEQGFLKEHDLDHHVKQTPINSDADLVALYQHAMCFVFPSIEEGFGIPILEAFACGCPVVLANSSCFPEIAGDAALFFDPSDKIDLLEKIKSATENASTRKDLIKKGEARLQQFNWDKTVAGHIEVYNSLIG